MNCPNCNHPLAPNGKFCPACGTPVVSEEFSSAKTRVMEDVPPTQEYIPPQPNSYPYEAAPQKPSPAKGDSPQQYGDSFQQPAGYQPPAAPDAYDYQPPEQQQNGYNEQFRQYQQPSRYGASHPSQPNGKPDMSKKNNMPLIIVIIVLAVLLVGGAIFAIIMLVNGNKNSGNQPATAPTAAVTTTVGGSSSQAQTSAQQQTSAQEQTSAQSSREESSQAQTSAAESSQPQQSSAAPYSGSHAVKNSAGVTLVEADSIHADDKEAETKLKAYLAQNNEAEIEKGLTDESYATDIFIQGNAVVYEMTLKIDVTDAQKQSLKTYLEEDISDLSETLADGRKESGVADMVIVYAYLAKDGSLIGGGVCDK